MDIVLAGSTVTRKYTDDELSRISIELSADATEIGVGTVVIDDEAGTDNVASGRQLKVSEGVTLLSSGFIGEQERTRGSEKAGSHLEHVYTVQDANRLVYGHRHVGRSRPAETDRARVLYFAAHDFPSADTTWVLNTHTETMAKKSYTGTGWDELMSDTFDLTGKLLFVHDKAGGGRCLHYHRATEGHTCGLSISDDPDEVDGVTVFAPQSPARTRGAPTQRAEIENNVYARDQRNRHTTVTDSTSISTHDADGLKHQAIVDFEASSQADLNAKAAAYLAESKNDSTVYRCTIGPLDQDALALIRVGDIITITSHVLGVATYTARIAHMTLTLSKDREGHPIPGLWDATLEIEKPLRYRGRARTGQKPVTQNQLGQLLAVTMVPFPGLGVGIMRDVTSVMAGRSMYSTLGGTFGDGSEFLMGCYVSIGGTGDGDISFQVTNDIYPASFDTWSVLVRFSATELRISAQIGIYANPGVQVAAVNAQGRWIWVKLRISNTLLTADAKAWFDGDTEPPYQSTVTAPSLSVGTPATYIDVVTSAGTGATMTAYYREIQIVNGTVETFRRQRSGDWGQSELGTGWDSSTTLPNDVFSVGPMISDGQPEAIPVAQLIQGEFVAIADGVEDTYTTAFPYIPGSLRVFVDGLPERNVNETDPDAGEFVFDDPPFATEEITVQYNAA